MNIKLNTIKKVLVISSITLFSGVGCTLQENTRATEVETPDESLKVGWIEKGKIKNIEEEIKFKLDTGAATTSINAEILEKPEDETESGGMIKFRYIDEDNVEKVFELPVVRWVKIKSSEVDYVRRPVVKMKMCIGGRWIEEEANLSDRDDFNYSVLIGRNMLEKGKLVIDSSETFTKEASSCNQEEE